MTDRVKPDGKLRSAQIAKLGARARLDWSNLAHQALRILIAAAILSSFWGGGSANAQPASTPTLESPRPLTIEFDNVLQASGDRGTISDRLPPKEQTSKKPALPMYFSSLIDDPRAITKVELDRGIADVAWGAKPSTKEELKLLQKQQSEVAKRAHFVTVNLQHGNTQGSGVIVSEDGYILTAAHVAGRPKQRINVVMHDGRRLEGVSLGMNRNEDAGLVKITSEKGENSWPFATLGRSTNLPRGAWVLAAGHPGGWQADRPTVVRVGRLLRNYESTLITDCALIGGDSGGPLFDLEGKLIGIHSRIGVDVEENMHVPLDVYYANHERLIRSEAWGSLPGFKPYIGVEGATQEMSQGRCLIENIVPNGPAARGGMEPGDIVIQFDGDPVAEFQDLKNSIESTVPGDTVVIEVQRGGDVRRLKIVIGTVP